MTAEVAILNGSAIALAADSAVTFAGRKVYNGGNKLFSLSDTRPRAAMIYGNAEINGVPWETVIKKYRAECGSASCASIKDVGQDLISYLASDFPFPQDCAEQHFFAYLVSELVEPLKQEIDESVRERTAGGATISRDQIRRIASTVVSRAARRLDGEELLPDSNDADMEQFRVLFEKTIKRSIDEVLGELPLARSARGTLVGLAVRTVFLNRSSDNFDSGLVVAGFGDGDIFPSLIEYRIRGVVNNKVLFREKRYISISGSCGAVVIPFAQAEEVQTFMEGIDPTYQEMVEGYVSFALDTFIEDLSSELQGISAKEKARILRHLKRLAADLNSSGGDLLAEYRRKTKWEPIMSAVAALPKEEMAAMAESLVNLTSLKRRVSMDMETVGGPIDVAVVSLADGLVWIKRKQYFLGELNAQFLARRYQSQGG